MFAASRHKVFKWHLPRAMSIPFVYENYQTMKKGCATDPCFRGPAKVSNVNLNVSLTPLASKALRGHEQAALCRSRPLRMRIKGERSHCKCVSVRVLFAVHEYA